MEAVKELADEAGMKLPDLPPRGGGARPERAGPDLYELLQRAARFYHEQLKSSPRAIDYLKGRGLSGQVAARYHLGYAPAQWQGSAPRSSATTTARSSSAGWWSRMRGSATTASATA